MKMSLDEQNPEDAPLLVVISGPSGVGKDVLIGELRNRAPEIYITITATTRPRRDGEVDGRDYIFITKSEFSKRLNENGFIENADVYGQWYGVPRDQVMSALGRGQDVIIKADVQGAATIRTKVPDALLIFLAPPSSSELKRRLTSRSSDTAEQLDIRFKAAVREMEESSKFDHVVINHTDGISKAAEEILDIITVERYRRQNSSL